MLAEFSVVQDGVQTWACSRCIDLLLPDAGLSSISLALCPPKRMLGICPYCKSTQEEALQTGLVGCPLCYEMLDAAALVHFGIAKGAWQPEKKWSLVLPNGVIPVE